MVEVEARLAVGTTVFSDPAKEYRYEDIQGFQLGFPPASPVPVGMLADIAGRNALRLGRFWTSKISSLFVWLRFHPFQRAQKTLHSQDPLVGQVM